MSRTEHAGGTPAEIFRSWLDSLPGRGATDDPAATQEGEREKRWRDEYKPAEPPPDREKRWLDEYKPAEPPPER